MTPDPGWRPIGEAPTRKAFTDPPIRCLVWSPRCGVQMGTAYVYEGEPYAQADGFNGEWGFTHFHELPPPPNEG